MSVQVTQTDLKDAIADYMASGLTYSVASATQQSRIDRILASGERMFLSPPPLPNEKTAHAWSFLLTAYTDGPTYPVTGQFAETLRQACLAAAEQFLTRQPGEQFTKFMECLAASIWQDRLYGTPDASSSSLAVAEVDVQRVICEYLDLGLNYSVLAAGAKERVDQILRSGERMFLTPPPINGEKTSHIWSFQSASAATSVTYPLDGIYAETLKQACLAAAEQQETGAPGKNYEQFISCLTASVSIDRHYSTSGLSPGSTSVSITLAETEAVVCDYLNIGGNYSSLPNGQKVRIDNIIRAGMRLFLTPPIIRGETRPHLWSFIGTSAPSSITFPLSGLYAQCFLEACLTFAEQDLNASTEQADNTPRPDAAGAPGQHYRLFLALLPSAVWFDRFFASPASGDSAGSSALGLTRAELKRAVVNYLNMGLDYSRLPSGQQLCIDDIIRSGERQLLSPPVLPGERTSHKWSFLEPDLTGLTFVNGVDTYDMPADFGGLIEPKLSFSSDDNAWYDFRQVAIGIIRNRQQLQGEVITLTNQPEMFAIVPKRSTGGRLPSGFEIVVWPTPCQSYTVTGPYYSNILAIDDDTAYPFTMQHAETLRESCLAAAELFQEKQKGAHYATFMERLATSVTLDRQNNTPRFLGYNDERSQRRQPIRRHRQVYATYNGLDYRNN